MSNAAVEHESGRLQTLARYHAAIQAGDAASLAEVLAPDAVTRWPQSGEQMTGAASCIAVYTNYPGGPPAVHVTRIVGSGDMWIAELVADYGSDRWYVVSIVEFSGARISSVTDYFGPSLPAPDWRIPYVDAIVQAG